MHRRIKFLIVMAGVFVVLLAVDKLFLQEPSVPLSQQIAGTDAMVFFNAAYENPQALHSDLAELDRMAETSIADAKTYLNEAMLRKSLERFENAVMRTPNAPLERLRGYIIANMGTFLPECRTAIAPQINAITSAMNPPPPPTPPGHKPRFYIFSLLADVMKAADETGLPATDSEHTPDKLAKFYSMTEIMAMKEMGMDELMARISNGTQTDDDSCAMLIVEAEALSYVPEHAYADMLKGAVISGIRLRLTNGPIAP